MWGDQVEVTAVVYLRDEMGCGSKEKHGGWTRGVFIYLFLIN